MIIKRGDDGMKSTRYKCEAFIIEEWKGSGGEEVIWWIRTRQDFSLGLVDDVGQVHMRTPEVAVTGRREFTDRSEFAVGASGEDFSKWMDTVDNLPMWKRPKFFVHFHGIEPGVQVIRCDNGHALTEDEIDAVLDSAGYTEEMFINRGTR